MLERPHRAFGPRPEVAIYVHLFEQTGQLDDLLLAADNVCNSPVTPSTHVRRDAASTGREAGAGADRY
jgi:hypothetical protein